jgi:predicted Holliday junction resolvase-like endonuclease
MSIEEQVEFFQQLRKTFVSCPCCGQVYRLSDSNIFSDSAPKKDWKVKLEEEREKISKREEKLKATIAKLKNEAKERGRNTAVEQVQRIDKVFAPLQLRAIDCKNICDPVDFIVFNGMHEGKIKNLVLLDRYKSGRLQQSIREAVEQEKYIWKTIRVTTDGNLVEEE